MTPRPTAPTRHPARRRLALPLLLAAACHGGDAPEPLEPLRIAVLMDDPVDAGEPGLPNPEWALENIRAAGGVAGRELILEYIDPSMDDLAQQGAELAADDRYVAVIGPPGSEGLAAVAAAFVEHDKPIVSSTSTSDELLRAYGGKGAVWRTRESDIAQAELLVRFARKADAERIALLTSLDVGGSTFFSWFGFFATELGYPADRVHIGILEQDEPCDEAVMTALMTAPDVVFVAAGTPKALECVVAGLPPPGPLRPRIVFADTGIDPYAFEDLGGAARGIEGFAGAGDDEYAQAFLERYPGNRLAPHGASEYDAVLLLAYGLEVSGGKGGRALISAMKQAVDGTTESTLGWDAAGVEGTLAALRAGERPRLSGASGPLVFEPELYMDLAASTLAHFEVGAEGLVFDTRHFTGDPSFLTSAGAFVRPGMTPAVGASAWTPATAKTDTWAVIAALSEGFSNYRHQSDALQQYQFLRGNGVDDEHIVLILAGDIAGDPQNRLPGVVRNEPGGDNIYTNVIVDYDLSVSPDDLANILTGQITATTPTVIAPTASSNVYIYWVGHGGTAGIPLHAVTAEQGIAGADETLSPTHLREALCTLREEARYRRVLAVIESCYAGAFGDAEYDGLERGCSTQNGDVPLDGVALLTAANSREVSYAGAHDDDVPAWVNDAFSRRFVETATGDPTLSVADLYLDVYQGIAGSHPSLFNADRAGQLTAVGFAEFVTP